MGCQIGRLTRHETLLAKPLARPKISTKISEPSRFARPFRSPFLDLPPAKTPSYRDTANLGLVSATPGVILITGFSLLT